MYYIGVTPIDRMHTPQGVYLPILFKKTFRQKYLNIDLDDCPVGVKFSDFIFEKIDKIKEEITIFLLFPPLLEFEYDFYTTLADKKIKIGAYCSDGTQYFNDWFRYLGLALDFFILSEPAEINEFERYLFKAFWHPFINLTSTPAIYDTIKNRKNYAIHLGSMKYRSERSKYELNKFSNVGLKFYGPDTGMEFLLAEDVPKKLIQYKIGVVFTQSGNRTIRAYDEMLDYSSQLKGKTWDYLFSGCVILTQESPFRSKYLPDDCCIIFKNKHDLFEKLQFYSQNIEQLESIESNAKILSKFYSEGFYNDFEFFLNNISIIDKRNKDKIKIYKDKIYPAIFTVGLNNLFKYSKNRNINILNTIGLINILFGICCTFNFQRIRLKSYLLKFFKYK